MICSESFDQLHPNLQTAVVCALTSLLPQNFLK